LIFGGPVKIRAFEKRVGFGGEIGNFIEAERFDLLLISPRAIGHQFFALEVNAKEGGLGVGGNFAGLEGAGQVGDRKFVLGGDPVFVLVLSDGSDGRRGLVGREGRRGDGDG